MQFQKMQRLFRIHVLHKTQNTPTQGVSRRRGAATGHISYCIITPDTAQNLFLLSSHLCWEERLIQEEKSRRPALSLAPDTSVEVPFCERAWARALRVDERDLLSVFRERDERGYAGTPTESKLHALRSSPDVESLLEL